MILNYKNKLLFVFFLGLSVGLFGYYSGNIHRDDCAATAEAKYQEEISSFLSLEKFNQKLVELNTKYDGSDYERSKNKLREIKSFIVDVRVISFSELLRETPSVLGFSEALEVFNNSLNKHNEISHSRSVENIICIESSNWPTIMCGGFIVAVFGLALIFLGYLMKFFKSKNFNVSFSKPSIKAFSKHYQEEMLVTNKLYKEGIINQEEYNKKISELKKKSGF